MSKIPKNLVPSPEELSVLNSNYFFYTTTGYDPDIELDDRS